MLLALPFMTANLVQIVFLFFDYGNRTKRFSLVILYEVEQQV